MKGERGASANPNRNENWQIVRQERIDRLKARLEDLRQRDEEGSLNSGIDWEFYQLYKMANLLGKMVDFEPYENYKIDEHNNIKRPEFLARSRDGDLSVRNWEKTSGFMVGKAAFGKDDLGEESKFWIFKNPGEARMISGRRDNKYIYRSKLEESDERDNEKVKIFNVRYSKGFLEVYSLAQKLLPENIPEFGVVPRLKYPDQFAVAMRFVKGGMQPQNILTDDERKHQYKKLRLVGSVIGFDDLAFGNLILAEDNNIKVIDGINPMVTGRERRGLIGLIERNFLDHGSFFGGDPRAESMFRKLLKHYPFIRLTVGDLKNLKSEIEINGEIISSHFDMTRQFNTDPEGYENYVRENINDLNYFVEFLESTGKEDDHNVNQSDIIAFRSRGIAQPTTVFNPRIDTKGFSKASESGERF